MKNQMMKNRGIPAIPYMRAVALFAQAKGLRFFTWSDWKNAIRAYELAAIYLN